MFCVIAISQLLTKVNRQYLDYEIISKYLIYRRARHPSGTCFITVNLLQRQGSELLTALAHTFRQVVRSVKPCHPVVIDIWVVLHEHLHCVIELPPGDADFALLWRLIKMGFSKSLPATKRRSKVRQMRGERGIWQRRFGEQLICNEADYRAHMDYVHFNPVKHGLVSQVCDWLYSTFHRLVQEGVYPHDCADGNERNLAYVD